MDSLNCKEKFGTLSMYVETNRMRKDFWNIPKAQCIHCSKYFVSYEIKIKNLNKMTLCLDLNSLFFTSHYFLEFKGNNIEYDFVKIDEPLYRQTLCENCFFTNCYFLLPHYYCQKCNSAFVGYETSKFFDFDSYGHAILYENMEVIPIWKIESRQKKDILRYAKQTLPAYGLKRKEIVCFNCC